MINKPITDVVTALIAISKNHSFFSKSIETKIIEINDLQKLIKTNHAVFECEMNILKQNVSSCIAEWNAQSTSIKVKEHYIVHTADNNIYLNIRWKEYDPSRINPNQDNPVAKGYFETFLENKLSYKFTIQYNQIY